MAIVYIHGLGSSPTAFNHLQQTTPGIAITYDSHQPVLTSIAQVKALLPNEENILIGHSLGGVIAVHLAHQTRTSKVMTISAPLAGSKPARYLRWFMFGMAVFNDLTPESRVIRALKNAPSCPVLSLTSTAGGYPTLWGEHNDNTVECSSQRALLYAKHLDVFANHTEILMHPDTVAAVTAFTSAH